MDPAEATDLGIPLSTGLDDYARPLQFGNHGVEILDPELRSHCCSGRPKYSVSIAKAATMVGPSCCRQTADAMSSTPRWVAY